MTVMVNSNPLLKILAIGFAVTAIGFIGYNAMHRNADPAKALEGENGNGEPVVVKKSNVRLGGDADTEQTDIQTLSKTINELKGKVTQLSNNAKPEVKSAGTAIDSEVRQQLRQMQEKVEELSKKNEELEKKQEEQPEPQDPIQPEGNKSAASHEEQRDFGIGADETPSNKNAITLPNVPNLANPLGQSGLTSDVSSEQVIADGEVEWVQPSDGRRVIDKTTNKETLQLPKFNGVTLRNPAMAGGSITANPAKSGDEEKKSSLVPIYTVPENSSFIGSVGATALIGRIPLNNQVTDAFPFKIVVGKKNLATNGIRIPNLQGMVVSGLAKGDYTLKCVYGQVNSITYTFTDGTIRTISDHSNAGSRSGSQGGIGGNGGGDGSGGLGYLADGQGVPCVSGLYITNLPEYLAQVGLINTAAGMAEAFAEGQADITRNTDGSSTSTISGTSSNNRYMFGKGISKGVQSGADALAQRQQGAYDAIYVQPGSRVEIHITKQLDIDYDKKGRKVSYVQANSRYGNARGLD